MTGFPHRPNPKIFLSTHYHASTSRSFFNSSSGVGYQFHAFAENLFELLLEAVGIVLNFRQINRYTNASFCIASCEREEVRSTTCWLCWVLPHTQQKSRTISTIINSQISAPSALIDFHHLRKQFANLSFKMHTRSRYVCTRYTMHNVS